MKKSSKKTTNSHDEWVISKLKDDMDLAVEYLRGAVEEAGDEEGQHVLMRAMRQIAKAQEMGKVVKRAGIPRESLSRALSPRGNPRLSTLIAVTKAMGFKLTLQPE